MFKLALLYIAAADSKAGIIPIMELLIRMDEVSTRVPVSTGAFNPRWTALLMR
jgi:hypothetical protein